MFTKGDLPSEPRYCASSSLTRAKRSSERRSFPRKSSFIVLRDRFSSCHKTSHPWAFLKAEALECRLLTDLWNLMTKSSPHKSSSELLLFHALEADRWGCAWSVYLDSDSDFGLSSRIPWFWYDDGSAAEGFAVLRVYWLHLLAPLYSSGDWGSPPANDTAGNEHVAQTDCQLPTWAQIQMTLGWDITLIFSFSAMRDLLSLRSFSTEMQAAIVSDRLWSISWSQLQSPSAKPTFQTQKISLQATKKH